jgi:colicin import membrane protein
MARAAVTYEQVAAVANGLYARGAKNPGTKAIREELAKRAGPGSSTGSPNTIQRHLDAWRMKDRPVDPTEPTPQLPSQLAADISRALNAAASVARDKVEERLAQVQAELSDLAESGEAYESQIDELTKELVSRTSERDSMAGQLAERAEEAAALKTVVEREQQTAERVRLELAKAEIRSEGADARVAEAQMREDHLRNELEQIRVELVNERQGKADAVRRADVAEARFDAERKAKAQADVRIDELQKMVAGIEGTTTRAAAAEASANELRKQVTMLEGMLAKADAAIEAGSRAATDKSAKIDKAKK